MRMKSFRLCTLTAVGLMFLVGAKAQATNYTLEDLLYQAMQSYPTILAKQSQKEAAKTDLTAAKLKFLPNPSFNTQRNQVAYSGQPVSNQPASTLQVSQPLWMGGSLIAGYSKADARLSAADYGLLESREDVSKRLITAYTEWMKAYLKTQALEENVRMHERFATMIDRRSEGGVASGADRDLGQSRLLQSRSELDTQRSIERTSLETVSQLVGQPVTRADLMQRLARYAQVPKRHEGIEKALAINPTIHRSKFEAEAAEAEAKEIRAQALPQVSFQAQRQVGNAYLPGAQGYDLYGLVVNYAPGGGFSSIASSSAAFDRAKAATMQVEVSKRDLTDKLNAEYNEYEFNLMKRESLKKSADLSGDISASYDRQYLAGRKSWLDLMNAVRERAQQRVALADAEGSLLGSSRRLLVYIEGTSNFDARALGSDLPNSNTTASKTSPSSKKRPEVSEDRETSGSLAGLVIDGKKVKETAPFEEAPRTSKATQLMAESRTAPGDASLTTAANASVAAAGSAVAAQNGNAKPVATSGQPSRVVEAKQTQTPQAVKAPENVQMAKVESIEQTAQEEKSEKAEAPPRELAATNETPVRVTIVGSGRAAGSQNAAASRTASTAPVTSASRQAKSLPAPVKTAKNTSAVTNSKSAKASPAPMKVAKADVSAKTTSAKSAPTKTASKTVVNKASTAKSDAKAANSKQPNNRKKA